MSSRPVFRRFTRVISLFLTALILAVVVWAAATNAADPLEKRIYPNPLALEAIGLNDQLILANFNLPATQLIFTAPRSTWTNLINNSKLIHVFIDLTGMTAGEWEVPVKTKVDLPAVRVEDTMPRTMKIQLLARTS